MSSRELCVHEKEYIKRTIYNQSYCSKCGILIINKASLETKKFIKPNKFSYKTTLDPLSHTINLKKNCFKKKPINYTNYYEKNRRKGILFLKNLCNSYNTNDNVFFISLSYLDRIMNDIEFLERLDFQLYIIVSFILGEKFIEKDAFPFDYNNFISYEGDYEYESEEIQEAEIEILQKLNYDINDITSFEVLLNFLYCGFIFENEINDYNNFISFENDYEYESEEIQEAEIEILQKLNYDICDITSFEVLLHFLYCGFIFENEINDYNKVSQMYNFTLRMLTKLILSDIHLKFDSYSIAFSIIHLCRKYFELPSENMMYLKFIYMIHLKEYKSCMNYIINYFIGSDYEYEFISVKDIKSYKKIENKENKNDIDKNIENDDNKSFLSQNSSIIV